MAAESSTWMNITALDLLTVDGIEQRGDSSNGGHCGAVSLGGTGGPPDPPRGSPKTPPGERKAENPPLGDGKDETLIYSAVVDVHR